mmetsp:Transcript_33021/g.43466  ORF Transcript_33021/g.43466 Transcript_33021/m.43466 type:complete len:252 (-) Transcript_33021:401-1156(-)
MAFFLRSFLLKGLYFLLILSLEQCFISRSSPITAFSLPTDLYISLTRQSESSVQAYLERLGSASYNFDAPGSTDIIERTNESILRSMTPKNCMLNHCRVKVGSGKTAYNRAIEALRTGENVNRLKWAELVFQNKDVSKWKGTNVATQAFSYVAWSVNPCRVVYSHWNEALPSKKGIYSSYGYSTIQGHLLSGEESFQVEWDKEDDSVWYDMLSFSRGSGPLGTVIVPFVRPIQRKFFKQQIDIMKSICQGE